MYTSQSSLGESFARGAWTRVKVSSGDFNARKVRRCTSRRVNNFLTRHDERDCAASALDTSLPASLISGIIISVPAVTYCY